MWVPLLWEQASHFEGGHCSHGESGLYFSAFHATPNVYKRKNRETKIEPDPCGADCFLWLVCFWDSLLLNTVRQTGLATLSLQDQVVSLCSLGGSVIR